MKNVKNSNISFISCVALASAAFLYSDAFAEGEAKSFNAAEIKKVEIDNTKGDITLRSTPNDQVTVTADKVQFDKECSSVVEKKGDTLLIRTDREVGGSWWSRMFSDDRWNCNINYEITVPKDVSVKYKGVSGDLSSEDFKGSLSFDVVSGDVDISAGELSEVKGKSVSGEVRISGLTGSGQIEVVSGDVMVRYIKVPLAGRLEVKSVSGDATIIFPPDAKVVTEFSTASGEFKNELIDIKDAPFRLVFKGVSGDLSVVKRAE